VKNLRSFAEPLSCPLRALFNHATKFAFVPVNEDKWFCFCQESNFEPLKLSGCFMYCQKFYFLPTLCMCVCFVRISQQTAIISLYSIHWLVFINETESVYWAVRAECTQYELIFYTTRFDIKTLRFAHPVFLCFIWIWEQTAIISLYNIHWLVFICDMEYVYCAVRCKYLCNRVFCAGSC
jgi:hypothetical protein